MSRGQSIVPRDSPASRFALLVFDPSLTNLVMVRFELDSFVRAYGSCG